MEINEFINSIKNKRPKIAVVGDILIDKYYYGNVERISPEFPVPILRSNSDLAECCPGGAANVCYQFKHFNTEVSLFGFVDNNFHSELGEPFFDTSNCVKIDGKIPRKIRFYDNNFPLLRWDIETPRYGLSDLDTPRQQLLENFLSNIDYWDAVILSNYEKGVFDRRLTKNIINACNKKGIITIVDPKTNPLLWQHCTIFKPNIKEAQNMTGESDLWKQAEKLIDIAKPTSVVITNAGAGVISLHQDEKHEYRTRHPIKDVSSVIGAGDSFMAALTLATVHGLTIDKAIKIAFESGAEYVKAKHNKPITLYQLHQKINPTSAKIVSLSELVEIKKELSNNSFIICNGCFDLLHIKHIELIRFAKQYADKVIVAINTDESVKKLKGESRPIIGLTERMKVLASLKDVDFVVPFNEETPFDLISALKPNYICKGSQYDKNNVVGSEIVGEDNVLLFNYEEGYSTTNVIKKIKSVNIT